MTSERIDTAAARALADAATEGPWAVETAGIMDCYRSRVIGCWPSHPDAQDDADQAFIAAARTLVPDLCDALDAAYAENDRLLDVNARCDRQIEAQISARVDAEAEVARLREALVSLDALMAAPTHASREALDQWRTVIAAALSPKDGDQ